MKRAVFPGSFDPVTTGHLDLIQRASGLCDELVIGVLNNNAKQPLFTVPERVEMLQELCSELRKVRVVSYDGLLADFVDEIEADCIVRGLRTAGDFEYELPLAQANIRLNAKAETIFLATAPEYSFISSSAVKELLRYQANVRDYVPDVVYQYLLKKDIYKGKSKKR